MPPSSSRVKAVSTRKAKKGRNNGAVTRGKSKTANRNNVEDASSSDEDSVSMNTIEKGTDNSDGTSMSRNSTNSSSVRSPDTCPPLLQRHAAAPLTTVFTGESQGSSITDALIEMEFQDENDGQKTNEDLYDNRIKTVVYFQIFCRTKFGNFTKVKDKVDLQNIVCIFKKIFNYSDTQMEAKLPKILVRVKHHLRTQRSLVNQNLRRTFEGKYKN